MTARNMDAWMRDVKMRLRRLEQSTSLGATPVGALIPYAGTGSPSSNWLTANGAAFSGATYPELADVLGGTTLPNIAGPGGTHYLIRAR